MSVYRVLDDDGEFQIVEACTFGKALETWKSWARQTWGSAFEETDEPESLEKISDADHVIREEVFLRTSTTKPE